MSGAGAGVTPSEPQVLVVDGTALHLATGAREATCPDGGALHAPPTDFDAVLVRRLPKRDIGHVLDAAPFFARLDRMALADQAALLSHQTPQDRLLSAHADAAAGGGGKAADLRAVFDDLGDKAARRARQHAKWQFVAVRDALRSAVRQQRPSRTPAHRPPNLIEPLATDGAFALALGDEARHVGLIGNETARRVTRKDWPNASLLAPDQVDAWPDPIDIVLLTTPPGDVPNAFFQALRDRRAEPLLVLILVDTATLTSAPRSAASAVADLAEATGNALGAPCTVRRFATVSHKPCDLVPSKVLLTLEVFG